MRNKKPHKHAELIKAWADGAEIEFFHENRDTWVEITRPSWSEALKYRIKPDDPKPEYIPFTWEDRGLIKGKWVKNKTTRLEFIITSVYSNPDGAFAINGYPAKQLLEHFTFMDGSLCGKLKETS